MDAYAADKVEQVMAMVDPDGVAVYGSDASEFYGTTTCLRQVMADDLRLWRTSRFGAMAEVTMRMEGRLRTLRV